MADRATALVLGSMLEQGLELATLSHCVLGWNTPEAEAEQKRLFGGSEDSAMTFGIKIRIAYALGVYGPKTTGDIDMMRHIRNFFAHDRGHLTFDDIDVSALCDQLIISDTRWAVGSDLASQNMRRTVFDHSSLVGHIATPKTCSHSAT